MSDDRNSGRKANDAQPLGERHGLASDRDTRKVGEHEQRTAGPDGPDPREAAKVAQPPQELDPPDQAVDPQDIDR